MLASGANNAYLLPAHHVHGVALALLRTHVANTKCGHHKSCRAQRRFSCASESSARRACTRGAQLHGQASGRIILFLSTAYSGGNSSLSFVSSQVWRRGVGSARAIDNTYRCMEALVSHLSIATRLVAFAKMCPLPAATAFGSARSTCAKSGVSYARHRRHTDSTLFAQQKWAPRALQCHITAEVQKMATGNYTAMSSSGLVRVATERNRIRRAERTTMQYGLPAHRPITSVGQHARAI